MAGSDIIFESLNKRGNALIVRIKQELISAGKDSQSGKDGLVGGTRQETKVSGSSVIFEGIAPEHYIFVDAGRRVGAKPPPVKPIQSWIDKKGLDLNAFAVAKSISKKGIKATKIYTNAVKDFEKGLADELGKDLVTDITKEINKSIN
jgi:hypothetical protein